MVCEVSFLFINMQIDHWLQLLLKEHWSMAMSIVATVLERHSGTTTLQQTDVVTL